MNPHNIYPNKKYILGSIHDTTSDPVLLNPNQQPPLLLPHLFSSTKKLQQENQRQQLAVSTTTNIFTN